MQEISIIDKRSGVTKTYTGPGSWAELSTSQFMAVMSAKQLIDDPFKQSVVLAQILFDIPLAEVKALTTIQSYQLAAVMNFLYQDKAEITAWHLPKIFRRNKSVLYGPTDTLGNICFGELMFADLSLKNYKKNKDIKHLNKLVAILYREGNTENLENTGDYREPFNKNLVDTKAQELNDISEIKKQSVLINYIGCRETMSKSFKNVFPTLEPTVKQKENNETWLDVLIQLARKENALGKIDDIEKANAWLVLKVLDKVIKESEEMQAEIDKLR